MESFLNIYGSNSPTQESWRNPDKENSFQDLDDRIESDSSGSEENTQTLKKRKWTPAEDEKLKNAVDRLGKKWKSVSEEIKDTNKNRKQCQTRWTNYLNPKLDKSEFTDREDEIILEEVLKGKKNNKYHWREIATRIEKECGTCRSPIFIKNYWISSPLGKMKKEEEKPPQAINDIPSQKKEKAKPKELDLATDQTSVSKRKYSHWSEAEDMQLIEAVEKHGKNFMEVCKDVKDLNGVCKTNKQCAQRWRAQIVPYRESLEFSEHENAIILSEVKDNNNKNWVSIAEKIKEIYDIDRSPYSISIMWSKLNDRIKNHGH